jgi:hypothetical protein
MPTRYQTYELTEGVFGTFDSNNEPMPTVFLRGPYDVNMSEAGDIQDGATIEIVDDEAIVYFEGEVL